MWSQAVTFWKHQSNRDWQGGACFAAFRLRFLVGQLSRIQKLITISLLDLKLWKIGNLGESLFSLGVKSSPKKQSMYVSTANYTCSQGPYQPYSKDSFIF